MTSHRRPETSLLGKSVRLIERIASLRLLWALLLLSLLFPMAVFPMHGIGDVRVLDLHVSYDPNQVYEHFEALGADKRRAYASMASTSDMLFPIVYSMALSVALMLILRRLVPRTTCYLCLFPFLIVLADWSENLGLLMAVRAFPDRVDAVVGYASLFTSAKWTLISLTLLMLFAAAVLLLLRRLRS